VALAEKDPQKAGRFLDWSLGTEPSKRAELVLSDGTKITAMDPGTKQRTAYVEQLRSNSGYFPARAMQARVVLRANLPNEALKLLEPILKEASEDESKKAAVTPAVKLTLAEALITSKGSSAADKDRAKAILVELSNANAAPPAELGRIAALIDPKLPKELDLPDPDGGSSAPPKGGGGRRPPPRRGR
jgi:hypothetical protein